MRRNIFLAYLLTFFRYSWFWVGIWIFYYLQYTNYAGIGLIETVQIIAITLCEIPTGAIADLFGKKKTLLIALFLQVVGIFTLALSHNFLGIVIGVPTIGIGIAFYSGTLEALVYDTLKELKNEARYEKVISNINSISLITPAVCGLIGGYLYLINPDLPFLLNGVLLLFGFFLCFFLVEPHVDTEKFSFTNFIAQNKMGFRELFKTRAIINQTILLLSIGVIVVICEELLNGFLGFEFKFGPEKLAVLFSVLYLLSAAASQLTPYVHKFFSYKNAMLLTGLLTALSLLLSPLFGIVLGGVSLAIRAILMPIFNNISSIVINEHTESKYRATALSTFNLIKNIPYVMTAYYLGYLADLYSAVQLAFFLGVTLLVLLFIQVISYKLSHE